MSTACPTHEAGNTSTCSGNVTAAGSVVQGHQIAGRDINISVFTFTDPYPVASSGFWQSEIDFVVSSTGMPFCL